MPIRSLTFSPDSQLLITASDDNHIKMYDVYHSIGKKCLFYSYQSHTLNQVHMHADKYTQYGKI